MTQRDPAPAGEPTPPTTGPANQPPPAAPAYGSEPAAQSAAPPAARASETTQGAGGSDAKGSTGSKKDTNDKQDKKDKKAAKGDDPLRGSGASHIWLAVILMIVIVVLLAVFVLQNTEPVAVNYFGFTGESPLAVALLIAFAAGLLVAGIAGTLRIWQLRRRVRHQSR